ncbi:MAG: BrnT family toxin [Candidatus Devosia phytovorans]|uniref:BrnT family toxin n=1 Tax=Candidatus Devosia phytovorans TaxID=3121372 RepID=A0AAJ6B045_9HYPH|nr:BrnT family toxin [Devosia sp.]WEK04807.1 MAG: BrnT family toxin [Devosia sp.]
MDYEWDENKRRTNIEKHDVDVLDAMLIFEQWVLTEPDDRFDYGEARYRSTSFVDRECYVVIHTNRNGIIRIISAWKGGQRDRQKYQAGDARRNTGDER